MLLMSLRRRAALEQRLRLSLQPPTFASQLAEVQVPAQHLDIGVPAVLQELLVAEARSSERLDCTPSEGPLLQPGMGSA